MPGGEGPPYLISQGNHKSKPNHPTRLTHSCAMQTCACVSLMSSFEFQCWWAYRVLHLRSCHSRFLQGWKPVLGSGREFDCYPQPLGMIGG